MTKYMVSLKKRGEHPQDFTEYRIIVEAQKLSLVSDEALRVMRVNGKDYLGEADVMLIEQLK
ncbi:MAG: hypothetical protein M1321_02275 [Candidatus Marsarchaeota archaeon]|jgi:hypothetical protein|nr:hypothetical protein [Candidatus Marsarchaeota archaeon]